MLEGARGNACKRGALLEFAARSELVRVQPVHFYLSGLVEGNEIVGSHCSWDHPLAVSLDIVDDVDDFALVHEIVIVNPSVRILQTLLPNFAALITRI